MKYILILLSSFLFGQNTVTDDTLITEDWSYWVDGTAFSDSVDITSFTGMSVNEKVCWTKDEIITVEDINNYAEECYNDSMFVEKTKVIERTEGMPGTTTWIWKEWEHKEPTFKGFIEWIGDKQ